jgi:sugar lactone lactonase YvrE
MHHTFRIAAFSSHAWRWPLRLFSLSGGLLLTAFFGGATTSVAQSFVAEWSEADIGRIGPTSMAIDTVGTSTYLYVTDDPGGRIIKIDLATGNRVAAWGQTGVGPLEFNKPYGIAVDPVSHDLYIAERGNHRIQRITNTGTFVMGWGSLGSAPGQFDSPIGIAVDSVGNVYVSDHMNNRVEKFHVYQANGGWVEDVVGVWGGLGAAPGQLNNPYGLTLDAAGNVWVADGRNHRIEKYDANGKFLATIGSYGTGDGQFVTPTWVNFDASGNYYVAETNSDPTNLAASDLQDQRIQKFSPTGTLLMKWGTYGEAGGQFKLPFDVVVDNVGNAYVADYYNTRVQKFSLTSPPPPPPPPPPTGNTAQFGNLSARLATNSTPGRELIAGFVISGSTSKQVLIRGIGPALTQFGVAGALPNPKLQIFSGGKLMAENEDWGGNAQVSAAATRLGAFSLPAGSLDAAMLMTLPPGNYSAQVGANGGDGVGMVEVYDADGSTTARLVNLSTRGFVDTGDGVLVAGFVINGSSAKKVLVRGVGPTLAAFGVTGTVADPVLKVYGSGSVLIAQNDNWGTPFAVAGGVAPASAADVSAAATATGAFALPAGSLDSAVVITLQPGAYSAIVSGANGGTGAGLVEVYELPAQ